MTIIISVLALFSCQNNNDSNRTAEDMISFMYRECGSERYCDSYILENNGNDIVMTMNRNCPDEKTITVDSEVLDDIQKIINRYKMYDYRETYTDDRVQDGICWNLEIKYQNDKQNITSSGCNAWPENATQAFANIRAYFEARFMNQR